MQIMLKKLSYLLGKSSTYFAPSLCALLIACGGSGGSNNLLPEEDDQSEPPIFSGPNFRFVLDPDFSSIASQSFIENTNTFYPNALRELNALVGLLPETVIITYRECGFANAFYRPSDRTITLCYELNNAQFNLLLDAEFSREDAFRQSFSSMGFIMYHEIGHALVDILDIAVAGNGESTADAIATVLSVEQSRTSLELPYSLISGLLLSSQPASYGGEHPNGEDRAGDIICWTVGGRTELLFNSDLDFFVRPFVTAGRDCVAEYQDQLEAVKRWLPGFAIMSSTIALNLSTNPYGSDLILKLSTSKSPKRDGHKPIASKHQDF